MKKQSGIHVGTSGWHYDHWRRVFYPEKMKTHEFLGFYAKHFNTVEINNTFYRLPDLKTVEQWRDTVPADFIFSVKASRYITHVKKLKDPEATLKRFLEKVEILQNKLGPILFQLPPNWHFELERVRDFIKALPRNFKYAFEFRDMSGFNKQVEQTLSVNNSAFCIYDFSGRQSPRVVTADFVYIRLHGPDMAYGGKYSNEQLSDWADFILYWAGKGKEIYCYFDNDQAGYAVQDALQLRSMLGS